MSSSACSEPKKIDDQIHARLQKLKEDNVVKRTSEEEITERLQGLKGTVQPPSEADISERLAKLKGTPVIISKPSLPVQDLRSEQEQADDLLKQYVEQTQIDTKYKDELDSLISDMEARMLKLKGSKSSVPCSEGPGTSDSTGIGSQPEHVIDSDNEEESVKKIIEKIRAEASIEEDEISPSTNDELPFCEICNEDATLRCLGCRYLFCKRCYIDHKDDDDGCNRYEAYKPPKGKVY